MLKNVFINSDYAKLLEHLKAIPNNAATEREIKHIAFFCHKIAFGGAERVVALLANMLAQNYKVTLVTVMQPCKDDFKLSPVVNRVILPDYGEFARHERLLELISELKIDLCVLTEIAWREKVLFDVFSIKKAGAFCISAEHAAYCYKFIGFNYNLFKYKTAFLQYADAVTCLSRCDLALWHLEGVKQAVYMPNPLTFDMQNITYDNRKENIILQIGFDPRKNVDMGIEAMSIVVKPCLTPN